MGKKIHEFRSLRQAEPAIRKLVQETSKLDDPSLLISVGRFAQNVEKVLAMAQSCDCHVKINAILGPDVKDIVLAEIRQNPNFEIVQVVEHASGHIPNFLVSKAGFYLQNGIKFDDAIASFEPDGINSFLNDLFQDSLGEAA